MREPAAAEPAEPAALDLGSVVGAADEAPAAVSAGVADRCAELLAWARRRGDFPEIGTVLSAAVYLIVAGGGGTERRQAFSALRRRYRLWGEIAGDGPASFRVACEALGISHAAADRVFAVVSSANGTGAAGGDPPALTAACDAVEVAAALRVSTGFAKRALAVLSDEEAPSEATHRVRSRLGVAGDSAAGLAVDADMALLGRYVCRQRARRCGECVLVSFCPARFGGGTRPRTERGVVDLFAGVGGLGLGFRSEGFAIVGAVEADRATAQTYRLNHPGTPVVEADVRSLSGPRLRRILNLGAAPVRVVLAGPPCQGYSKAGKRMPGDDRNYLFREVARLGGELAADWVVVENVPGLRGVRGTDFRDTIVASLRDAGFPGCGVHVLAASDFGVPQARRRLFFVANRSGVTVDAPAATHIPPDAPATVGLPNGPRLLDVLAGLPALSNGVDADGIVLADGRALLNGSTMRHSARVVAKIRAIPQDGGPISYRRLNDNVARTLVAGHRALPIHPRLHRTVSVREAARIQGFGDEFAFCGSRAYQPLMVANAVPPPMSAAVARQVRDALCIDAADAACNGAVSPSQRS